MSVSRNKTEFLGKVRNVERTVGHLNDRKNLGPVATVVQGELERAAASAGLRKGSKIAGRPWAGVYVRPRGTKELAVGYSQPAHLVNSPTKPHIIGSRFQRRAGARRASAGLINLFAGNTVVRFRGRSTAKGAKVLHWGDNFAAFVKSPGTRGKRFFERSKTRVQAEGATAAHRQVLSALSEAFR